MTITMKFLIIFLIICSPCLIRGNINLITEENIEERRTDFLVYLIKSNLKQNGWANVIYVGSDFPVSFYNNMKHLYSTFTVMKSGVKHDIDDIVPYHPHVIVMNCLDFDDFENNLHMVRNSPYWHPHAHIFMYYHAKETDDIAKIFMIFWYYIACDVIVIQYDDGEEKFHISYYSPYMSENYRLSNLFGCWKATKLGRPVLKFRKSFVCEEGCHNVTLHSKLRALHLGTCIGFHTHTVSYSDRETLKNISFFEPKSKDLHGFVLRGHAVQVLPFVKIDENSDGTYSLSARDGKLWNVMAEYMNFTIDLTASKDVLKAPFHFEVSIQQISSFAQRQVDLLIFPVYQFDLIIVEIDMGIAYKDSGVCIMSHRADYETVLFDANTIKKNINLVVRFFFCFICIWLLFFIFNCVEKGRPSFDQAGKDLVNTFRSIMSISLHNPPRRSSFRIYLFVAMWCFFIINFATQAAIISFFTAYKRGKEVDTFEDVIEKGYVIEGMASPDMMLPDSEERFQKINAKLVPLYNLYQCVNSMTNDSRRFCLIDCAVGRYLEINRLNEKGEQYLHIATKDRIHSHYLVMLLHKHSPLTNAFNKILRICFEAGLIKKWEQYRFSGLKDEGLTNPLNIDDLIGIFKCYCLLLALSSVAFVLEVIVAFLKRMRKYVKGKTTKWMKTRNINKKLKLERKLGKMKPVNAAT